MPGLFFKNCSGNEGEKNTCPKPATLLQIENPTQMFSSEYCGILKNNFCTAVVTSGGIFYIIWKMPNCSAAGCTNGSSKNLNVIFHRVRNEW